MNSTTHLSFAACPRSVIWTMGIAWGLILAKCALVAWAISRWSVPVNPAWIILPTLAFAALATVLWLTHREE